jgi:hypothetical protein
MGVWLDGFSYVPQLTFVVRGDRTMERRNFFAQILMMSLAALVMSLPALAQAKKESAAGVLRIMQVSKRDTENSLVGKQRLVPVSVKMELHELVDNAKLQNIQLQLVTLNTDGSQSKVEKLVSKLIIMDEIKLPMADKVFAKSFTLTATASILRNGKVEQIRASKSGSF